MKKNIVKILVGIIMIVSVLVGYIPHLEYLHEMTCISNTAGGILLIIDAILGLCGKNGVPDVLLMNVSVCILTIFFICMGSLTGLYGKFNFSGAFFLLHVVTPIAFITLHLFLCNKSERTLLTIFTAPIMMLCYLLFDYIQCRFTGKFVYGLVEPEMMTIPYAAIAGIIVYILMCLLAVGLTGLRRLIHKKA